MNNRQRIYEAIKSAGGWIELGQLVEILRIDKTELNNSVRSMFHDCSHKYPGIKISSKRTRFKNRPGQRKASYNIKYKYEGEE